MWLKRKHEIIAECPLADYVNGAQTEKVPFVFMPPQGHLINANAEISLSGNISHYSLNYFFYSYRGCCCLYRAQKCWKCSSGSIFDFMGVRSRWKLIGLVMINKKMAVTAALRIGGVIHLELTRSSASSIRFFLHF